MVDCLYVVDGIEVRFIKFQYITSEEGERVILYTTARNYKIDGKDMPAFLQGWIPVEREGVKYYDHLSAESGLQAPANNFIPGIVTVDEQYNAMLINFMQALMDDNMNMQAKLDVAYLGIKDLKAGPAGEAYIKQANTIAKLADMMIKGKLSVMGGIKLVSELMEKQKNKG